MPKEMFGRPLIVHAELCPLTRVSRDRDFLCTTGIHEHDSFATTACVVRKDSPSGRNVLEERANKQSISLAGFAAYLKSVSHLQ